MEANELRIGNWVNVIVSGKGNKASTVESISYDIDEGYSINLNIGYRRAGNDAISGIPLTEEWLLKFGFEGKTLGNNDIQFKYKEYMFDYSSSSLYRNFPREGMRWVFIAGDLHKVHQLQNLYFALTGEELLTKNQ